MARLRLPIPDLNSEVLYVRTPPDMIAKLDTLRSAYGCSRAALVRTILNAWFDAYEKKGDKK